MAKGNYRTRARWHDSNELSLCHCVSNLDNVVPTSKNDDLQHESAGLIQTSCQIMNDEKERKKWLSWLKGLGQYSYLSWRSVKYHIPHLHWQGCRIWALKKECKSGKPSCRKKNSLSDAYATHARLCICFKGRSQILFAHKPALYEVIYQLGWSGWSPNVCDILRTPQLFEVWASPSSGFLISWYSLVGIVLSSALATETRKSGAVCRVAETYPMLIKFCHARSTGPK